MRAFKNLVSILVLLLAYTSSANGNFFDERNRGWLYFDEREREQEDVKQPMTAEEAKMRQEIFKQRLEDARAIMNMEESLESIRDYQLIEKEMYDKGIRLSEKWKLAAFKYPELFDHKKDPVNVHAVKLNRELEQEKLQLTVSKLARDYDLVLFMRGDCIYCKKFEPVLSEFALKYNFSVDAVTRDGTHSKNFKTFKFSSLPNYVKAMLQEDAVPQLIAVSKDGKNAFQLGNGLLTMSELEENSEMAIKVLESKVNENE